MTTLSGLLITSVIIIILTFFTTRFVMGIENIKIFYSSIGGIFAGFLIGLFTLIYTDSRYRTTRNIAESANSGPGTLVVNGLAYGMESTILPALTVIGAMIFSFYIAGGSSDLRIGLYSVAIETAVLVITLSGKIFH